MSLAHWIVLGVNVVWFGLGFRLFALKPGQAIRLLVARERRAETSSKALLDALPFLGGMNLAFAALSGAHIVAAFARQTPAP